MSDKTQLSDIELEFIANAALAFDGMIAEEQANLEQIAEISRFLIAIYAKNANLSDDEKAILRQAYKILV
ncbi:hypothetical protein [Cysteiniphilum litorale]|uniref:hypothetical protein n=1 Tax=Cysteiniphilum litorale TaxID=2056700 RepID=UPI003F8835B5